MYCDLSLQYIQVRKLFKGGNYSRAEAIHGNTVFTDHGTTGDISYEKNHLGFNQTIDNGIIPATDYQFHVTLEMRYNGLEISDEVSLASENRESKELKIECKSKPPTPYGNYFHSYQFLI